MALAARGFVNYTEVEQEIGKVIRNLGPDVVHVAYNFGEDWTGDPGIFFRIVLTNEASQEGKIGEVAQRISTQVFDELRPQENWGLFPFFNFRSQADQDRRPDPLWA
jgi:hypothetical protein